MNAVEAMSTTAEKLRVLAIASRLEAEGVTITVEDSGADRLQECGANLRGLLHDQVDRHGNKGLAICRSIMPPTTDAFWASPGNSCGAIFHVVLPVGAMFLQLTFWTDYVLLHNG